MTEQTPPSDVADRFRLAAMESQPFRLVIPPQCPWCDAKWPADMCETCRAAVDDVTKR